MERLRALVVSRHDQLAGPNESIGPIPVAWIRIRCGKASHYQGRACSSRSLSSQRIWCHSAPACS